MPAWRDHDGNAIGDDDPLGKTIRLQNLPFRVIGVMQPKGLSSNGMDQDDFVIIPYTTAMKKLKGIYWLDDIFASAASADEIEPAVKQVGLLLRQRHHLRLMNQTISISGTRKTRCRRRNRPATHLR